MPPAGPPAGAPELFCACRPAGCHTGLVQLSSRIDGHRSPAAPCTAQPGCTYIPACPRAFCPPGGGLRAGGRAGGRRQARQGPGCCSAPATAAGGVSADGRGPVPACGVAGSARETAPGPDTCRRPRALRDSTQIRSPGLRSLRPSRCFLAAHPLEGLIGGSPGPPAWETVFLQRLPRGSRSPEGGDRFRLRRCDSEEAGRGKRR